MIQVIKINYIYIYMHTKKRLCKHYKQIESTNFKYFQLTSVLHYNLFRNIPVKLSLNVYIYSNLSGIRILKYCKTNVLILNLNSCLNCKFIYFYVIGQTILISSRFIKGFIIYLVIALYFVFKFINYHVLLIK